MAANGLAGSGFGTRPVGDSCMIRAPSRAAMASKVCLKGFTFVIRGGLEARVGRGSARAVARGDPKARVESRATSRHGSDGASPYRPRFFPLAHTGCEIQALKISFPAAELGDVQSILHGDFFAKETLDHTPVAEV